MRAFSMVSAVVKVLETITTRVVSGLRPSSARATSTGSTLARKRRVRPSAAAAAAGSAGWSGRARQREFMHTESSHTTSECLIHKFRAQVAPTDANGHDVRELLASGSDPLPGAYRIRKCRNALQHGMYIGHDVASVHNVFISFRCTQGHVHDCTVLRDVDVLSTCHGSLRISCVSWQNRHKQRRAAHDFLLHLGGFGKFDQIGLHKFVCMSTLYLCFQKQLPLWSLSRMSASAAALGRKGTTYDGFHRCILA